MHLDDERIQRLLHGELSQEETAAIQSHIASCPACMEQTRAAREEEATTFRLLEALDQPPRDLQLTEVERRARHPVTRYPVYLRWAAAILVALGVAATAYAAPGSPLPTWLHELTGGATAAAPDAPSPETGVPGGGVSVDPGTGLRVALRSWQDEGVLTVSVESVDGVVVEASGTSPTFTSDEGRLLVDNASPSGDFLIRIPPDAPRVEILVGGQVVFSKIGTRIRSTAEAAVDGKYRISLARRP